ncbi:MAG: peptidase M29 [Elusimicrobia bacterium GWA2_56_46]|nr:MAG: peptidase M29 [Elusimicrobia bacterium GWA2_56_46]OGR56227.1 MAG: peptidase M29 [Elusimicrobia bacterium GWC2_56_31]HBW22894.1 aminopeptidase [Elusimicrobiota bacterium]
MLSQTQLEKYAEVLLWGLKTARPGFKKYDTVLVRCDLEGRELGEIVNRRLVQAKFNVVFRFMPSPRLERDFYMYSDAKQRKFTAAGDKEFFGAVNGNIYIHAPASLTHLKGIDTKRQSEVAIARKPLRDLMIKNEEKGKFGWTLCTYPTEELARQAKLSVKEYAAQIAKACFLNEPDPAKKWDRIYKDSTAIKKWLKSLNIDTLRTESGSMDLTVKVGEMRRFLGVSGHNIPSFEIFTSPDWRGTNGIYYANLPAFRGGNYVEGVRLEFKNGRAVKISAKKGDEYVKKIMATDKGAAQLGEYSLTDRRFSGIDKFMADTLFDENHGGGYGNCHVAVGDSYSDTYAGEISGLTKEKKTALGFNNSAVHWDLINTEDKKVTAKLRNGRLATIYEKGQFKY